jgi:hypothetical protein
MANTNGTAPGIAAAANVGHNWLRVQPKSRRLTTRASRFGKAHPLVAVSRIGE